MLIVITGGSGSGKSDYAETLAVSLGERRIYAATMMVYDEEGRQRVRRHRAMRESRNFCTVECPVDLETIAAKEDGFDGAVVLLECMSNLVANEMFLPGGSGTADGEGRPVDETADKILKGVQTVLDRCRHLIVVTNEVFSDGNTYDPGTEAYIRALGQVNLKLAAMADRVTEVVCGIPVDYPGQEGKGAVPE